MSQKEQEKQILDAANRAIEEHDVNELRNQVKLAEEIGFPLEMFVDLEEFEEQLNNTSFDIDPEMMGCDNNGIDPEMMGYDNDDE